MTITDDACDNVGAYGYVHGESAHPGGCHQVDVQDLDLNTVGEPHNWWLNIGGKVNSDAEPLPV